MGQTHLPPPPIDKTKMFKKIVDIPENECRTLYRVNKAELIRLHNGLFQHLPPNSIIRMRNGCQFESEEILLFSLRRLKSHETLDTCARSDFGRDYSQWSRAFRWFVHYIKTTFEDKLGAPSVDYFWNRFPLYAEAIRTYVNTHRGDAHFARGDFPIFGFIDCKNNAIARPGGGPARAGVNAPRNNPLIQQAFYNGWLRYHGIKNESVDLPDGLSMFVYGPSSSRQNDITVLHRSGINALLMNVHHRNGWNANRRGYCMYGDSIYPYLEHLKSKIPGALTLCQRSTNLALNAARESIEWHYGEVNQLFPFSTYKCRMQLRKMPVGDITWVCFFLRNCLVCLGGGNKTSKTFNCFPPSFENYVS